MKNRYPFTSYPSGWFAVAFASEVGPCGVKPLRYFGKDLVLYRTAEGKACLSDAHCPHMGAHLGHGGRVEGQQIVCPFHGWCFDGPSGQCVTVPFASKVPPRAKLRMYPVRETDGILLAYHHADDGLPDWEVPTVHDEGWSDAAELVYTVRTCCQEVLENSVDTSHLPAVHQARRPARCRDQVVEGPVLRQLLDVQWDGAYIGAPGTELDVTLDVRCYGVGMIYVDTVVEMMGMTARQRIFVTPVEEETIHLRAALHVRRLADDDTTRTVANMFRAGFEQDFVKDFPIWENKAYLEQPLLSDADGPIMVLRRWARQFYA